MVSHGRPASLRVNVPQGALQLVPRVDLVSLGTNFDCPVQARIPQFRVGTLWIAVGGEQDGIAGSVIETPYAV